MARILEVRNISKVYEGAEAVHAVRDVTLHVEEGEFVALLGASGSGKSTLLHLIAGLDLPTAGEVILEGKSIYRLSDRERTLFRRERLGIVFQAFNLLPTLTALENVTLPTMIGGTLTADDDRHARELLALVDMQHRLHHRPQALSGGEQQRVAIARAMMNNPALILADEPTGNLDSRHGEDVWRLLARLAREQSRTVIAVTHAMEGAVHAGRIVVIRDGEIAGEIEPGGERDAAMVGHRYAQLAG